MWIKLKSYDPFCLYAISSIPLFVSPIYAQQHSIDVKLEHCLQDNYSTDGMIKCTQEAMASWDGDLNKHYQSLKNALDNSASENLKKSQLQWISFRNEEFNFIENMQKTITNQTGNEPMYKLIANNQKMQLIRKRALQLKQYYEYITSQNR